MTVDPLIAESLFAFVDFMRAPYASPEGDAAAMRIGALGAQMTVEQAKRVRELVSTMGDGKLPQ